MKCFLKGVACRFAYTTFEYDPKCMHKGITFIDTTYSSEGSMSKLLD